MPKNLNHSFTFVPTQTDVDAYLKFKSGEQKSRIYMKDYKSLHHIKDLSDTSILVYEAIRNLVGLYVLQQNAISKYKDTKDNKIDKNTKANKNTKGNKDKSNKNKGIGTTRETPPNANPYTVVGTTLTITNPMLQEWIGDKSHNTIKSALAQLESMGFIKCVDATGKKSGRKITLLRDMDDYQPEEIFAIESYIKNINMNTNVNECKSMSENMSESDMNNDINVNDSLDDNKSKNKIKNKNNSKSAINKSEDSTILSQDSVIQSRDDSSQNQKPEDTDTTLKKKSLKSLPDAIVSGLGNGGKVDKMDKVDKVDDEIDEVDEFEGFDF